MRTLSLLKPPRARVALGSRTTLAAATCMLAAAGALAGTDVSSLVYAGGEALPPEAEARLLALTTTPGGSMTRSEVRQQWAEARQDGSLPAAGEIADLPSVLLARSNANDRQTRQILAAHEAERQRVAALEAQAEARRQAELQQRQVASESTAPDPVKDSDALAGAAAPQAATAPAAVAEPLSSASDAPAASDDEAPRDTPAPQPPERPLLAPAEVPISRPSDLPVEVLIEKE